MNPLKKRLEEIGIPTEWLRWSSWDKILSENYPFDLYELLRKILFEKQKGFEIYFATREQFKMGKVPNLEPLHINWVLVWSRRHPNVMNNLYNRSMEEKFHSISRELGDLLADIQKMIKIKRLTHVYKSIKHTGNESYEELLEKCENAREELRWLKK
jgi:hypothetical protein